MPHRARPVVVRRASNHPLWAVGSSLPRRSAFTRDFPVKGFIPGRVRVSQVLRQGAEERRAVEGGVPQDRARLRASEACEANALPESRRRGRGCKRRKKTPSGSTPRGGGQGMNGGHPPRRKGSRSVEEVAAAMSKRENGLGANGNPGRGERGGGGGGGGGGGRGVSLRRVADGDVGIRQRRRTAWCPRTAADGWTSTAPLYLPGRFTSTCRGSRGSPGRSGSGTRVGARGFRVSPGR